MARSLLDATTDAPKSASMTTRITVKPRGPLVVEGDVELYDERSRPIDLGGKKKVALCRCGHSRTRPLCDGSHNRVPFEAPE